MNIVPDHIKMDVDGLEHRVINGGLETIEKAKTVIIELNTNLQEHNNAVSKMKSLGFKLDFSIAFLDIEITTSATIALP